MSESQQEADDVISGRPILRQRLSSIGYKDVSLAPNLVGMSGKDLVDNHLMRSADYFWRMWQRIEAQKSNVQ